MAMNDFYYLSENQLKPLAIEDKPIGKGGQAVVYRIVFPIQLDMHFSEVNRGIPAKCTTRGVAVLCNTILDRL